MLQQTITINTEFRSYKVFLYTMPVNLGHFTDNVKSMFNGFMVSINFLESHAKGIFGHNDEWVIINEDTVIKEFVASEASNINSFSDINLEEIPQINTVINCE